MGKGKKYSFNVLKISFV